VDALAVAKRAATSRRELFAPGDIEHDSRAQNAAARAIAIETEYSG
jgi:hypothetical protein